MKKQTKTEKIATLERQLGESLAQLAHVYHFASATIDKASVEKLMGSGVVLTFTVLGGREICSPVCIRDGLSPDTIAALKSDFLRSFELATMHKPKV